MVEVWRPVVGYEGAYEVSDRGAVRSLTRSKTQKGKGGALYTKTLLGRLLRPGAQLSGHLTVALGRGNSRLVHQLVIEAFVGPRPINMEVRHLNGNPRDNRRENLAWGTRGDNTRDKKWHGNPRKLSVVDVINIRHALATPRHGLGRELARRYNVHESTISAIKHERVHTDV